MREQQLQEIKKKKSKDLEYGDEDENDANQIEGNDYYYDEEQYDDELKTKSKKNHYIKKDESQDDEEGNAFSLVRCIFPSSNTLNIHIFFIKNLILMQIM